MILPSLYKVQTMILPTLYKVWTMILPSTLIFFIYFYDFCNFQQCEYCEIGNVSIVFPHHSCFKILEITRLRLVISRFLKHSWCGKSNTHISSSQYSLNVQIQGSIPSTIKSDGIKVDVWSKQSPLEVLCRITPQSLDQIIN